MTSCGLSIDLRQFFQIDAIDPILQFLGVLILQLDLDKITIGNHDPQSGMFAFSLEWFKPRGAIDSDGLVVTFTAFAVVIPRWGGGAAMILVISPNEGRVGRGCRPLP